MTRNHWVVIGCLLCYIGGSLFGLSICDPGYSLLAFAAVGSGIVGSYIALVVASK